MPSRIFKGQYETSSNETYRPGTISVNTSTLRLKLHDGTTAGGIDILESGTDYQQSSAVLYVDNNRTDSYTATGTIIKPYKTVQAAINAATPETTIYIAPGTYTENIVMRDLEGIALVGGSEMNTNIINYTAGHTFSWVAGASTGAAVTRFGIQNIEFQNTDTTGSYHSLHFDGTAVTYPNTFLSDEFDLIIVDCDGQQAQGSTTVYFNKCGGVFWYHGQVTGGDLTVINTGVFRGSQLEIGELSSPTNFNVTYDTTLPYNGLGRNGVTLATGSVVWGNVILAGHPIYQEDIDSLVVGNVIGSALTSYYAVGHDYCPTMVLYGQHGLLGKGGGNIAVAFPDPQSLGSAFNVIDLSDSHILGNMAFTKASTTSGTARAYAVILGQGQFDTAGTSFTGGITTTTLTVSAVATGSIIAGQIITGAGVTSGTYIVSQISGTTGGIGTYTVSASQTVSTGTTLSGYGVSANGFVVVDLKGGTYSRSLVASSSVYASIDQSTITIPSKSITTGGTAVTISPPLPTGATYIVSAISTSTNAYFTVSSKTVSGFTLTSSANCTADVVITRIT